MTENIAMLLQGMWETLYMTIASVVFSYLLGLPLGVLFVSTSAHGIAPRKKCTPFWAGSLISGAPSRLSS